MSEHYRDNKDYDGCFGCLVASALAVFSYIIAALLVLSLARFVAGALA